jgi:hypothetical protein
LRRYGERVGELLLSNFLGFADSFDHCGEIAKGCDLNGWHDCLPFRAAGRVIEAYPSIAQQKDILLFVDRSIFFYYMRGGDCNRFSIRKPATLRVEDDLCAEGMPTADGTLTTVSVSYEDLVQHLIDVHDIPLQSVVPTLKYWRVDVTDSLCV